MGKKGSKESSGSKKINVEIAPGNRTALEAYIESYNARPDRTTPKIKYTDVLNLAVDRFMEAHLAAMRKAAPERKKKGGESGKE